MKDVLNDSDLVTVNYQKVFASFLQFQQHESNVDTALWYLAPFKQR
jgi:hypothetical protein